MKVLFISSGNTNDFFKIAPFIQSQGDSLQRFEINVQYFQINGKGLLGYIRSAYKLRKFINKNPIDIIHAHYTLCGWTALLAFTSKPLVLSLMGSDAYGNFIGEKKIELKSRYLRLLTYLIQPFVNALICKSKYIESFVYLKNKAYIIPNGVLLDDIGFEPRGYREELGLNTDSKIILFLGNKFDARKNFNLVKEAFDKINKGAAKQYDKSIELVAPHPIPHEKVVKYLNSADVLVAPSFMEGSPNIIKEAMASNCPVVATDVGDIRWLFGNEPGHFITGFEPDSCAEQIKLALNFAEKQGKTNGRNRIIELGLDADTVAYKIIDVYKSVLKNR